MKSSTRNASPLMLSKRNLKSVKKVRAPYTAMRSDNSIPARLRTISPSPYASLIIQRNTKSVMKRTLLNSMDHEFKL